MKIKNTSLIEKGKDTIMYAYHVVTEKPMQLGQQLIFDEAHHNGVYRRVQGKLDLVKEVYEHPEKYKDKTLEHHTSVALRELALEEVRLQCFPHRPSRMNCLYVSETLEEAKKWASLFCEWGRPTYHIVKLHIDGNCFVGDATKCFDGTVHHEENIKLAKLYWEHEGQVNIQEMLVDGIITVVDILEEINQNL